MTLNSPRVRRRRRLPLPVAAIFRRLLPVAERDEVLADLQAEYNIAWPRADPPPRGGGPGVRPSGPCRRSFAGAGGGA